MKENEDLILKFIDAHPDLNFPIFRAIGLDYELVENLAKDLNKRGLINADQNNRVWLTVKGRSYVDSLKKPNS